MLFNGDGVPRDYLRAYALMTRASQAGLQSASQTLAQMDQYISPADREQRHRAGAALCDATSCAPGRPPPAAARDDGGRPPPSRRGTVPIAARGEGAERRPKPARRGPVAPPARSPTLAPHRTPAAATRPAAAPAARRHGASSSARSARRQRADAMEQVRGKLGGAQPVYVKAGARDPLAGERLRIEGGGAEGVRARASHAWSSRLRSIDTVGPRLGR